MSTPEMPSVSVWCDLWISPTCSPPVDALDEPELPQRAVAVEHLRHEPLGELEQLAPAPGRGQRGQPHVVGDVEAVVVDPDRAAAARTAPASPACGSVG